MTLSIFLYKNVYYDTSTMGEPVGPARAHGCVACFTVHKLLCYLVSFPVLGLQSSALNPQSSVLSHGLNHAKIATQVATPIATRKHILLTSHLEVTSCPPTHLLMLQETKGCLSHTVAEGRISSVFGTLAIL